LHRYDELLFLGLHGQAADWSGGMGQRFRVTKGIVEDSLLDGKGVTHTWMATLIELMNSSLSSDPSAFSEIVAKASSSINQAILFQCTTRSLLAGYEHEYLGLLDRDADGMGVWKCGENMTITTHAADTTMSFFLALLRVGLALPGVGLVTWTILAVTWTILAVINS
jgi:hypothetical protein